MEKDPENAIRGVALMWQQYLPNLYNKHGLTAGTFAQQLQGLVYPPEVTTSCPGLYIICISGIWVGPHGPSLSAGGSPG